MLKKLFVIVLILVCGLAAFAQDKPRLGILPFTGGPEGDADTITTLLTYHSDILQAFSPVPITNAVKAQAMEQSFQLSDWVDADISSGLGRLMNADFVISGQIRRIGTQNIVIISLVNVKTFELLAGVCREYNKLDEIPGFLPEIAQTFVSASRKNTSMLPRLAVLPPAIASEVANAQEAETLAQILSIELANMGRYAVLPRIVTGLAIEKEMSIRLLLQVYPTKSLMFLLFSSMHATCLAHLFLPI